MLTLHTRTGTMQGVQSEATCETVKQVRSSLATGAVDYLRSLGGMNTTTQSLLRRLGEARTQAAADDALSG